MRAFLSENRALHIFLHDLFCLSYYQNGFPPQKPAERMTHSEPLFVWAAGVLLHTLELLLGQLKKLGLWGWQCWTPAGVAKDKGIGLKKTPVELKVTRTLEKALSLLLVPLPSLFPSHSNRNWQMLLGEGDYPGTGLA